LPPETPDTLIAIEWNAWWDSSFFELLKGESCKVKAALPRGEEVRVGIFSF
jgi:hypothetical protein